MTTKSATQPEISADTYRTLEQLRVLNADELAALWDAVPTERQAFYQKAYESQVRGAGAQNSDRNELLVIADLMRRYTDKATIPVSDGYWTGVPAKVRQAAQTNAPLKPEAKRAAVIGTGKPNPLFLVVGAVVVILLLGSTLSHGSGQVHPPLTGSQTATATLGGTPIATSTPTPLALDAQDSVIKAGDPAQNGLNNVNPNDPNARLIVYPVNLRVFAPGTSDPRVFVVQNRKITTTEWNFDANPDTASYLTGLYIRPVIGIPWSDSNAQLFDQLAAGARFELQMNTGTSLIFNFASKASVIRSNTLALRQSAPGLVLLLIGQRDETGSETATRVQVEASYAADQEMASDGSLAVRSMVGPTPIPPTATQSPTPYEHLQVDLISVTAIPGTPNGTGNIMVRLHIVNEESTPVTLGPDTIWMAFGYSPDPLEPRIPSEGLTPFQLLPDQAVDLTIYFPWAGETQASFGVNEDYRYQLQLTPTTEG